MFIFQQQINILLKKLNLNEFIFFFLFKCWLLNKPLTFGFWLPTTFRCMTSNWGRQSLTWCGRDSRSMKCSSFTPFWALYCSKSSPISTCSGLAWKYVWAADTALSSCPSCFKQREHRNILKNELWRPFLVAVLNVLSKYWEIALQICLINL